ncbi:MAG: ABC transporter ATP-binding protein/permease [Candidatus Saccharibacteria bacterium]|nr:ABC transporter ATP-binding protein/permease [Candidatus Saccharibacteria bacterium]
MFKLFKNFKKKDWLFILLAILFIAGQVGLELKMPEYMSTITRLVQTEGSEMGEILQNGVMMLLCAFGSLLSTIIAGWFVANVGADFTFITRKKIFDKVERLGINEIKKFSTASLITRTTNDVTQVRMVITMGANMLIRAPMSAIWAIAKISGKSWQWSTATAVAVVIMLATVITIMMVVTPRFKIIQKLTDKLNGVTRENLTGIRVVRAFNAEKYQEKKFDITNTEVSDTTRFVDRVLSVMSPMMYLVMNGITLTIYLIGATLISQSIMSDKLTVFSDMVVFSTYAMHVIMSFLMVAMIFMMIPRAQVSAERINEVLDEKITVEDGNFDDDTAETGTVEFRNVSFKYPDAEEYLLKDISFRAEKGQTVAFIGSTGSGKSTLINLVPRFYDVTDGAVFVDGVNVKDYKQKALHQKLGYIPQKAVIFSGTVASNISYGDNSKAKPSERKIQEAAKVAQAKNFVEKLDKQYNAHIAQAGTNISGGQKQRLAIARAVARDPEIYIFDDSFSALDYKTDASLRKALKEYTKDATSLIVAQRIGTIMHADQILVLDKGRCVGRGTHKELLKNCEVYKEIALSQLTKEELNV